MDGPGRLIRCGGIALAARKWLQEDNLKKYAVIEWNNMWMSGDSSIRLAVPQVIITTCECLWLAVVDRQRVWKIRVGWRIGTRGCMGNEWPPPCEPVYDFIFWCSHRRSDWILVNPSVNGVAEGVWPTYRPQKLRAVPDTPRPQHNHARLRHTLRQHNAVNRSRCQRATIFILYLCLTSSAHLWQLSSPPYPVGAYDHRHDGGRTQILPRSS